MRPNDYLERQAALSPTESIICEAPAGSGKTELLTQRFLTLLARVEQPESIIAITFTRKAAGEMRQRILAALKAGLANDEPKSEHERLTRSLARQALNTDREHQWQLMDNPNRLRIITFDSLSASLANHLPFHSSFSSPPSISEQPENDYRQAANALLSTLEQSVPWADAIEQLLRQFDNNRQKLERLLADMLARRELWLNLLGIGQEQEVIEQLQHNLQQVRRDAIEKVKQCLSFEQGRQLVELSAFAASNLRRAGRVQSPIVQCLDIDLRSADLPESDEQGVAAWQGIVALLLTYSNQWRRSLDRRIGFPTGETSLEKSLCKQKKQTCLRLIETLKENAELRSALMDIRYLPATQFSQSQRQLLLALTKLLPVLSAYLSLTFKERNHVDFNEISIKALMALGSLESVSELSLKLDYQIQHLLVDEFQDTSPAQMTLLNRLTEGWQADDGRTLFCVGDAMQSIYSFRGAEVGLFIHALEAGLGPHLPLKPIRLTTNFRSQAGIIEWVNKIFQQAFPSQSNISDGAVKYSPSTALHDKLPGRAVWAHGFGSDTSRFDEARTVLGIIRKTKMDHPEHSIAILVRNRNHASHILPLLKEAGIRYRAVDLEPLKDKSVIQDLMALTLALSYPADRISWLSILRAPWCGLSLVDLEAIANASDKTIIEQLQSVFDAQHTALLEKITRQGQADFFTTETTNNNSRLLTPDGQARLERVMPILLTAFANQKRKPLRQWIEGTWLMLGGPACSQSLEDQQNAQLFFNLLEQLDTQGSLSNRDALTQGVERLFAVSDPLADGSLSIMTIHKAKGLEFDTVIVPSLQRAPRRPDPELLRWRQFVDSHGDTRLIMAPVTASGQKRDPIYQHLVEQEKKRQLAENCRLLYVACTRAKAQLHLLAEVKVNQDQSVQLRAPAKASLLHCIWDSLQTRIRVNLKENTEASRSREHKPKYLQRLTRNWQLPALPEGHLLDQYIPYYQHNNEQSDTLVISPDISYERHVGTLVHQVLQQIAKTGLSQWSEDKIQRERFRWQMILQSLGVQKTHLNEATSDTVTIIHKIIHDPNIIWMLGEHPIKKTEYPVTLKTHQGYQALAIDLLIHDGTTGWVIDYKTSQPKTESIEEFIETEKQRYQKTMNLYRKAAQQLHPGPIKTALYFPLIGAWGIYGTSE